jgi:hypothetical protein
MDRATPIAGDDPVLDPDAEALRWFPLPQEITT